MLVTNGWQHYRVTDRYRRRCSHWFGKTELRLATLFRTLGARSRRWGDAAPIIVEADGRWYVGPGNGLFELVLRRAAQARSCDIDWKPERLSASFHGRDLFAPVAGMLARGEPPGQPREDRADRRPDWPDDLSEVVYVDHYGNAITGLRVAVLPPGARLAVIGRMLERGRTFSDLPPGAAFWYENSNGLAEIAVNKGRAVRELGLATGITVEVVS